MQGFKVATERDCKKRDRVVFVGFRMSNHVMFGTGAGLVIYRVI